MKRTYRTHRERRNKMALYGHEPEKGDHHLHSSIAQRFNRAGCIPDIWQRNINYEASMKEAPNLCGLQ